MTFLLTALGAFAAGWIAGQLSQATEAGSELAPLDPFSAVLLEETRSMFAELYAEADLEPREAEELLERRMLSTEAEFRRTPPWEAILPALKQNVRPIFAAQVRHELAHGPGQSSPATWDA